MNLLELRTAAGAALEQIPQVTAGDWVILESPFDAVTPPAFVLSWGPDTWRTPATYCTDNAQLEIIAVSARLTPEANYPVLEAMVDQANAALIAARLRPFQTLSPGPLEVAQVTYLAARVQLRQPVETGGTP